MKYLFTAIFSALLTLGYSQVSLKEELPPMALLFVSGAGNGAAELSKWRWNAFQSTFPNANPEFFNPEISWRNKYKNGNPQDGPAFFGSTTFLVGATDFYHASRTVSNTSMLFAVILSPRDKLTWKSVLIKFVLYSVSYHAGFWLTYELPLHIYKQKHK